jgi:hypothetical protein
MEMRLDTFQPLSLPVPPMLEAALGYPGTARYVAFSWLPGGDELIWDDGWSSADGAWAGWLQWTRHPRVAPCLRPFHFGDSDTPATHWLLLDREARTCMAGPARAVHVRALRTGNPTPETPAWTGLDVEDPLPARTAEEWQALVEGFRDVQVTITPEEIFQRMAAHARVLDAMQAWLDDQMR